MSRRLIALLLAATVLAATVPAAGPVIAVDGQTGASAPAAPTPGPSPITIEVVVPGWPTAGPDTTTDLERAARAVTAVGGRELGRTPTGVLLAEIPDDRVEDLATMVTGTVRAPLLLDVRPPDPSVSPDEPDPPAGDRSTRLTIGEHVAITGAAAWHAAGQVGTGVRVGIIDYFNVPTYWNVAEMGPLPVRGVTARCFDSGVDCTGEFFAPTALPADDHGPAVVEIIRDMAPGAQIYIGRATTESDYYELIDWFVANGVRIVNRSLGSRFDGPGDGRGALTAAADHAAGRGILWINSAGNNGRDRYYRHPVRLVGDRVAFGPSGTDLWLRFRGCITPGGVRWAGDWDLPASQRTDYDVFIHDAPTGNPEAGVVIASSTLRQSAGAPPLETFTGSRCPAAGRALYLRVERVSGSPAGDVLEILDFGDGITSYTQASYSAAVPVVDSRSAGVISVGAIDPPGSGTIAPYSSQGPTNDGRIKPDLAAPAGTSNVTFGGTFAGTSAAAPVVAGGAALLWGAGLAADSSSLGDLVRHTVIDRGPPGRDQAYGTGEFRLPAPPVASSTIGTPSRYVPLAGPVRVLDTRPGAAIGPPALIGDRWPGRIVDLPASAIPGAPQAGVTAVVANLTVVEAARGGYTQAFPTAQATVAGFSNLNVTQTGQTRPNIAIVPVGADGRFSIYSTSGGHLLVDVLGTFVATGAATAAGRFVPLGTAQRVLDTRRDGTRSPLVSGRQAAVPLPTGVEPAHIAALVMTVTGTQTVGAGFVQALPAGRTQDIGRTSTLNLTPGLTAANTVIVPASTDGVRLFAELGPGGSAHVIADVTGYITSAAAPTDTRGRFVPVRPGRALDTRASGVRVPSGGFVDVPAPAAPGSAIPAITAGVMWNLTVTGTTTGGYLRGWPAGGVEPPTSTLNWVSPETTVAAGAVIGANAGGVMRVRADAGPTATGQPLAHVIVDVFGYFM